MRRRGERRMSKGEEDEEDMLILYDNDTRESSKNHYLAG